MKSFKLFQFIFCFLVLISLLSCSDENTDLYKANDLIGAWEQNDSSKTFEYKLFFEENQTGYNTVFTRNPIDDTVTSSLTMFSWNIKNDQLTIDGIDEITTTKFSIDTDGHLFLPDMTISSDVYFIKIE